MNRHQQAKTIETLFKRKEILDDWSNKLRMARLFLQSNLTISGGLNPRIQKTCFPRTGIFLGTGVPNTKRFGMFVSHTMLMMALIIEEVFFLLRPQITSPLTKNIGKFARINMLTESAMRGSESLSLKMHPSFALGQHMPAAGWHTARHWRTKPVWCSRAIILHHPAMPREQRYIS